MIVAVAENGVVGRDNALPWRLSEDLKYFKRTTLGKPLVMGRKTFESIGRPLPGRPNIVISRDSGFAPDGVEVAHSLPAALERARELATGAGVGEVMVIGGAQVYAEAIPLAARLYVTEVHAAYRGDTYLPPVDWTKWRECTRELHPADAGSPGYSFVVFERR